MTSATKPPSHHHCMYEDRWSHTESRLERIETKEDHNSDIVHEVKADMARFEEKLDKIIYELHEQKIQSDNRLSSVETVIRFTKWAIGLIFGTGVLWLLLQH